MCRHVAHGHIGLLQNCRAAADFTISRRATTLSAPFRQNFLLLVGFGEIEGSAYDSRSERAALHPCRLRRVGRDQHRGRSRTRGTPREVGRGRPLASDRNVRVGVGRLAVLAVPHGSRGGGCDYRRVQVAEWPWAWIIAINGIILGPAGCSAHEASCASRASPTARVVRFS